MTLNDMLGYKKITNQDIVDLKKEYCKKKKKMLKNKVLFLSAKLPKNYFQNIFMNFIVTLINN